MAIYMMMGGILEENQAMETELEGVLQFWGNGIRKGERGWLKATESFRDLVFSKCFIFLNKGVIMCIGYITGQRKYSQF